MLLGMKNKKRMWTIGLTFLGSSALVYMLIMLSWLNIVVSISTSIWVRNVIAIIAIGGGLINLYNFIKHQDSGCSVVDEKKRKSVFARIKKFTKEKSLILAMIGAVALAFSVNIIELACSAGLPLVFTQLLAINNITGVGSFMYVLLYIIFFLLDDLVIFFIAMKTMEVTGFSTKYSKYSHLVGGLLMVLIGILLIVKPEWLMFQF
jgi:cytochrome c biogenesis protein CcdA